MVNGTGNDNTPAEQSLESVARLTRDLKQAAFGMTHNEARYLVDAYYQIQEYRKAAANQYRALAESNEPNSVIGWLQSQNETLESQIKRALDAWTDQQPLGKWAKSVTGIGPVITAGLMSHIDINQAPTVGHIWRFAGLDPTLDWLGKVKAEEMVKVVIGELKSKGLDTKTPDLAAFLLVSEKTNRKVSYFLEHAKSDAGKHTWGALQQCLAKRPWNANLKTLCWKIGESFVKVSGLESDVYGKVYMERKALEQGKNAELLFAGQAKAKLERFNIGKTTDAYAAYSNGLLPPAHIHARAKRYAVKLFLAHYHHVAYRMEFNREPPKPYVIEHLGHVHFIPPPNFKP